VARIFVSSTFRDLEECREKVGIVLRKMGHEDVSMENFFAEDKRPFDKHLEDVASCDLYVGIFAWRYGSIAYGYDKSITELEYRKAVETGKKCLIFLLHEEAPWPIKFIDRGENASKIRALRDELTTSHLIFFFESANDLANKVAVAIHNWETQSPQTLSDNFSYEMNKEIGKVTSKEHDGETIEWKEKNERYINELKKSYYMNGLVLFLGAGVSLSAGMPDWETLISKLIVDMIDEELSKGLDVFDDEIQIMSSELKKIHGFSPLLEARYVRASLMDNFDQKICENLYKDITKTGIGTSKLFDSIIKLCMPKRTGPGIKAVVNYNFDDLIETHLRNISIKCCPICSNSYFISPEQLPIYHVHGFLPRDEEDYKGIPKSSVIFSEEGYHNLMQDAYHWSNIIQLNFFLENTCLMIGLSVTDPNLRRLLDVAARNNNVPKHYVLLKRLLLSEVLGRSNGKKFRENVIEAFISKHHRLQETSFQQLGLNIIWFENYDEIPQIIDKIID